jgi:hypothetical protein
MIKKEEEKKKKVYNYSIKINIVQSEEIAKRLENKELSYRSASNFIEQAVEKELMLSGLKSGLSKMGKYHFDLLYAEGLRNAYERAVDYDVKAGHMKLSPHDILPPSEDGGI